MAKYKVVVLGSEDAPLEAEREELAGIDCEIIQTKPTSEGEAMEAVKDADAILMRGPWGTEQVINATENCQECRLLAPHRCRGLQRLGISICVCL